LSTRKTRTLFATLAATLAVVLVPASSHALTAKPTGDRALDDYCAKAAALIDKALTESHLALIDGRDEDYEAWSALAVEMIKRSQDRGCEFRTRQIRRILRDLATHVGPIQTEPGISTGGTSTGGSTVPPGGDAPPIGPTMG
jgi:hypothetical protein